MDFEFNPFRLLIPPGGEPIRSIQITSNIDWLTVPGPITGQQALMPLNTVATIPALKVFATGSGTGAPTMRSLLQSHIPNIEISQVNGLQAAINSLVKSIASGSAALSVTNNGVGDYLITPNFGTTSTTFAIGNDSRFPASVTGIRLGVGAGSFDTAAITRQHYWDRTVFIRAGDPVGSQPGVASPDRRGLVPDPGAVSGATRFLNEDGTWKTPAGSGTVSSITVTVPSDLAVAPATITTSGTFAITRNTQTQNKFLASPIGGSGAPTYRVIDFSDVSALTGTTATKLAIGNDVRFPAVVTGLRKGAGNGSADVVAVRYTDYWDNTVFGAKGPSSRIGLVPDPGPGAPPYTRFLKDDGTWQPITVAAGSVDNSSMSSMPSKTLKANATGSTASPTDVSAKDARSSLLLNLESITTFGNTDYTALATDTYIATTTTFTTDRTVTLPLANTFNPGQAITISDDAGAIGAFVLKVARQGSDTTGGSSAALVMNANRGSYTLASDGVNKWSVIRRSPSVAKLTLTSGTTYTTPTGVKALYVEVIGGGGGGGAAQSSAANAAAASGGGGGGYAAVLIPSPKSSYNYVIGAGGATAFAGGNTTFDSPSICTATGGTAGTTVASGGTSIAWTNPSFPGTGTVGDILITGQYAGCALRLNGTAAIGGNGGNSMFGAGGIGIASPTTGLSGTSYGGGGAGAVSYSATGVGGGAGAQGAIIITEYY